MSSMLMPTGAPTSRFFVNVFSILSFALSVMAIPLSFRSVITSAAAFVPKYVATNPLIKIIACGFAKNVSMLLDL